MSFQTESKAKQPDFSINNIDPAISFFHKDALSTSITQIEDILSALSPIIHSEKLLNIRLQYTLLTFKSILFNLQSKYSYVEILTPSQLPSISKKINSAVIALGLVFYYVHEILTSLLYYINEMKVFNFSKINFLQLSLFTHKLNNIIQIIPTTEKAKERDVFPKTVKSIESVEHIITDTMRSQFNKLHRNIYYANSFVNIGQGYPLPIRLLLSFYGILYYSIFDSDLEGAVIAQSANPETAVTVWNLPDTLTCCCYATCIPNIYNNYTFEIPGLHQNDPMVQMRLLYDKSLSINCCFFSPLIQKLDLVIHVHGGGFIGMSSFSHQNYTRRWSLDGELPLISIDYRLAPKYKYPCALDDCYAGYQWCIEQSELIGFEIDRVILVGDSAGGNLVTGIVIRCIRDGYRIPNGLILCYPALVVYKSFSPSLVKSLSDPIVPYHFLSICLSSYLGDIGDEAFLDPCLCPLFASDSILSHFPPTRIMTGSEDPIHDHAIIFGSRLNSNLVNVHVHTYQGLPHGFLSFDAPLVGVEECRKCINLATKWIKELLYIDWKPT